MREWRPEDFEPNQWSGRPVYPMIDWTNVIFAALVVIFFFIFNWLFSL